MENPSFLGKLFKSRSKAERSRRRSNATSSRSMQTSQRDAELSDIEDVEVVVMPPSWRIMRQPLTPSEMQSQQNISQDIFRRQKERDSFDTSHRPQVRPVRVVSTSTAFSSASNVASSSSSSNASYSSDEISRVEPRRMSLRSAGSLGRRAVGDAASDTSVCKEGPNKHPTPVANALFPMFAGRRPMVSHSGTRVELHAHLEGSVRHATIWELMKTKNLELPGDGSLRALKEAVIAKSPVSLAVYGEPIPQYIKAFAGDIKATERMAHEFAQDKAEQGLLHVEARYVPHWFLPVKVSRSKTLQELCEIVAAVNRGFKLVELEYGITLRSILVIVVGLGNAGDVINLCQQFRDQGVVGIDMMLPYDRCQTSDSWVSVEEVPLSNEELQAFQTAAQHDINRTVHAGHTGSAYMVQRAVDKYRAQRVGHGYEVVKLPSLYAKCRERNVHFECCPWGSLLTGAVDPGISKHPIAQFAEDGVNFSLNSSDPTITGVKLQEEYDLANSWGLTEAHIVRANINALRSSFLPKEEKEQQMQVLLENIGIRQKGRLKSAD